MTINTRRSDSLSLPEIVIPFKEENVLNARILTDIPNIQRTAMFRAVQTVDHWYKLRERGETLSAIKHLFYNLKDFFYFYFKGGLVRDLYNDLSNVVVLSQNPARSGYKTSLDKLVNRIAHGFNGQGNIKDLVETHRFLGIFFSLEDPENLDGLGDSRNGHIDVRFEMTQELSKKLIEDSYQDRVDAVYTKLFFEKLDKQLLEKLYTEGSIRDTLCLFPNGIHTHISESHRYDEYLFDNINVSDNRIPDVFPETKDVDNTMRVMVLTAVDIDFAKKVNEEIRTLIHDEIWDFAQQKQDTGLAFGEEGYIYDIRAASRNRQEAPYRINWKDLTIDTKINRKRKQKLNDQFSQKILKISEKYTELYHEYWSHSKQTYGLSATMDENIMKPEEFHGKMIGLIQKRDNTYVQKYAKQFLGAEDAIFRKMKGQAQKVMGLLQQFRRDMTLFGSAFLERQRGY